MSQSTFVTSHLVVGGDASGVSGPKENVSTVRAAVQGIEAGLTVILPEGAFDTARDVLIAFGANRAHADRQIEMARGVEGDLPDA